MRCVTGSACLRIAPHGKPRFRPARLVLSLVTAKASVSGTAAGETLLPTSRERGLSGSGTAGSSLFPGSLTGSRTTHLLHWTQVVRAGELITTLMVSLPPQPATKGGSLPENPTRG